MKISSEMIPDDIKVFLEIIYDRINSDFNVYIIGGYLRDKACGKEPKDLDIALIPKEGKPLQANYIPDKCYVNYNKFIRDIKGTEDLQKRGVYQIVGMFNRKLSTSDIQYIVYDKYMTREEVASDMDMGLAQIVWCPEDDTIYATQNFIDDNVHKVIKCYHEYDADRMYRRYERMKAKFPDYIVIGMPEMEVLPEQEQKERKAGTYKRPTFTGSFISEDL